MKEFSIPKLNEQSQKELIDGIFNDPFLKAVTNTIIMKLPVHHMTYLEYVEERREGDGVSVIGLQPLTKFMETQRYNVTVQSNMEQLQDISRFGIDPISMLQGTLIDEATLHIQKQVWDNLSKRGDDSYLKTFTRKDKILTWIYKNILRKEYVKYVKVKNPRHVVSKILTLSNKIAVDGRRGSGTAVVVGGKIGTLLMDDGMFQFEQTNNVKPGSAFTRIGRIANLEVWQNNTAAFSDMSVTVIRKPMPEEPALHLGYMQSCSLDAIDVQDFADLKASKKIIFSLRYTPIDIVGKKSNNVEKIHIKLPKGM